MTIECSYCNCPSLAEGDYVEVWEDGERDYICLDCWEEADQSGYDEVIYP